MGRTAQEVAAFVADKRAEADEAARAAAEAEALVRERSSYERELVAVDRVREAVPTSEAYVARSERLRANIAAIDERLAELGEG